MPTKLLMLIGRPRQCRDQPALSTRKPIEPFAEEMVSHPRVMCSVDSRQQIYSRRAKA